MMVQQIIVPLEFDIEFFEPHLVAGKLIRMLGHLSDQLSIEKHLAADRDKYQRDSDKRRNHGPINNHAIPPELLRLLHPYRLIVANLAIVLHLERSLFDRIRVGQPDPLACPAQFIPQRDRERFPVREALPRVQIHLAFCYRGRYRNAGQN